MPPMYVNVGAYVGAGTMIDSHALVGSCAQIGERVHLSAAAQIGGVLEPVNAAPVVIEDDVLVGGNCGVYEGTIVRARAVLAAGVILTRGTPVFDLVKESVYRATHDRPLEIPEGAVVVPGARGVDVRLGRGAGAVPADAGHREVPRREDGPRDRARGMAAMTATARGAAFGCRATSRSRTARSSSPRSPAGPIAHRAHPRVGGRTLDRRRAARARCRRFRRCRTTSSSPASGQRRVCAEPATDLDCGNSGTTARLLAGVVAGCRVDATFVGDASLSRRPMRRDRRAASRDGRRGRAARARRTPDDGHGGALRDIEWTSPRWRARR